MIKWCTNWCMKIQQDAGKCLMLKIFFFHVSLQCWKETHVLEFLVSAINPSTTAWSWHVHLWLYWTYCKRYTPTLFPLDFPFWEERHDKCSLVLQQCEQSLIRLLLHLETNPKAWVNQTIFVPLKADRGPWILYFRQQNVVAPHFMYLRTGLQLSVVNVNVTKTWSS